MGLHNYHIHILKPSIYLVQGNKLPLQTLTGVLRPSATTSAPLSSSGKPSTYLLTMLHQLGRTDAAALAALEIVVAGLLTNAAQRRAISMGLIYLCHMLG